MLKTPELAIESSTRWLDRVRAETPVHKDQQGADKNKKPTVTFKDVQQILNVQVQTVSRWHDTGHQQERIDSDQ